MSDRAMLLIVEDDEILGTSLQQRLELEGYRTVWARDTRQALESAARQTPDAILCDIRLPDGDGETLMQGMFDRLGAIPTVFMTAYGSIDQAVRLVRMGARDYVAKPFDLDEVVAKLGTAAVRGEVRSDDPFATFGLSPAMAEVRGMLERVASVDLPVLLLGETGTGKEIAARFLHAKSDREDRPFTAVNCAALPPDLVDSTLFGHEKGAFTGAHERRPGLVETSASGTFFLDEIGELDALLQAKLLRLIQEREFTRVGGRSPLPFEARLVCATHRDLEDEVGRGTFREDLWYRINVITLRIPPLRERLDEIDVLFGHFVDLATRRLGAGPLDLAPDMTSALRAYDWPGNVRELRNRVERAVALARSGTLTVQDIFPEGAALTGATPLSREPAPVSASGTSLAEVRDSAEKAHIEAILATTSGNMQEAARTLGISRTTLWEKVRRYGIRHERD